MHNTSAVEKYPDWSHIEQREFLKSRQLLFAKSLQKILYGL